MRHTALRIATTLPGGVDTLVIELAALFHDLADGKLSMLLPEWVSGTLLSRIQALSLLPTTISTQELREEV